jgi:uncharacterized caspase-like protein
VLLLLDACHSGAVGAQTWATDPDAKVLQDAMDLENVTVLTSSKKNELSEELPEWKHGALAEAFLDALKGAADAEGIVRLSALTDAMENEVQSLTKGRQHTSGCMSISAAICSWRAITDVRSRAAGPGVREFADIFLRKAKITAMIIP